MRRALIDMLRTAAITLALLVLWLVLLPMVARGAEPTMQFTDEAGHLWCGKVQTFDTGADALRWAWFVADDGPPHAVFHVPVRELRAGCAK